MSKQLPRYDYFGSLHVLREIASYYPNAERPARNHNFITPEIVACIKVGNAIVELSFGKGMGDYATYGITVWNRYGISHDLLSRALFTSADVEAYLKLLKQVTTFGD